MPSSEIDIQRRRDAAFFEDWSEWDSLDDLPAPDKPHGVYVQWPTDHHRYWCILRKYSSTVDGPAFELSLPEQDPIHRMVMAIPGIKRRPGRYHQSLGNFVVPAEHWQHLRTALPKIKAAVLSYVGAPR